MQLESRRQLRQTDFTDRPFLFRLLLDAHGTRRISGTSPLERYTRGLASWAHSQSGCDASTLNGSIAFTQY